MLPLRFELIYNIMATDLLMIRESLPVEPKNVNRQKIRRLYLSVDISNWIASSYESMNLKSLFVYIEAHVFNE